MNTEQGLYEKAVMIRQKYLKITEVNKDKNENKFKFQGRSARSQNWFDFGFDWTEEILAHVNLIYIRKYFKGMINTQDTNTFKLFVVPIINAKNVGETKFHFFWHHPLRV